MLPYRFRPPVYGGPLKWLKTKQASENAHSGGGPLQQAIERDLAELESDFFRSLREDFEGEHVNGGGESGVDHSKPGSSFRLFKKCFENANFGLVFSYVPPRCDPEAFAQLVYASCLSLLEDAFEKEPFRLERASFAMFCLYTLYRINPLPKPPPPPLNKDGSVNPNASGAQFVDMLSMGLRSSENPRNLYRRSFSPLIRIDRRCFALVLQLRDEARGRRAFCDVRLCAARRKNLETKIENAGRNQQQKAARKKRITLADMLASSSDEDDDDRNMDDELADKRRPHWKCICGIAQDSDEIIDRMMSAWDFCDYTGPVGLEGLSGHAKYPCGFKEPTACVASARSKLNVDSASHLDYLNELLGSQEDTQSGETNAVAFSEDLRKQFNDYHLAVRKIQFPKGADVGERARISLKSILESSKGRGLWNSYYRNMNDDSDIPRNDEQEDDMRATEENETIAKTITFNLSENTTEFFVSPDDGHQVEEERPLPRFKLTLPGTSTNTAREGIQNSIGILLKREGISLFVPPEKPIESKPSSMGRDDISTVGYGGISTASGLGQAALTQLLSTVEDGPQKIPRVAVVPTRLHETKRKFDIGSFLDVDEEPDKPGKHGAPTKRHIYDSDSDLSYLSEEDDFGEETGAVVSDNAEVSVATSAVGGRALKELLANISDDPDDRITNDSNARINPGLEKSTEDSAATSAAGQFALQMLLSKTSQKRKRGSNKVSKVPQASIRHHKTIKSVSSEKKTSTQIVDDFNDISVATSAAGQVALQALLSEASKKGKRSPVKSPSQRKRKVSVQVDSKANRAKHDHEPEDLRVDDASVATSSAGQAALKALLSKASQKSQRRSPSKKTTESKVKRKSQTMQAKLSVGDNSVGGSAATSAAGQAALKTLLSEASQAQPGRRKGNLKQSKFQAISSEVTEGEDKDNDGQSVDSSDVGMKVLCNLIYEV